MKTLIPLVRVSWLQTRRSNKDGNTNCPDLNIKAINPKKQITIQEMETLIR